jgi:flagellar motor component MotA
MRKVKSLPATSPLEQLVQNLWAVESTSICVQTSIGAIAALANPARFASLVADAADAAHEAGEPDLEDCFEQILEYAEKSRRDPRGRIAGHVAATRP